MAGGVAMDGGKSAGLWSSPWKASLVAEVGREGGGEGIWPFAVGPLSPLGRKHLESVWRILGRGGGAHGRGAQVETGQESVWWDGGQVASEHKRPGPSPREGLGEAEACDQPQRKRLTWLTVD